MYNSYLSGVDAPDVMPMVTLPFFKKSGVTCSQRRKVCSDDKAIKKELEVAIVLHRGDRR